MGLFAFAALALQAAGVAHPFRVEGLPGEIPPGGEIQATVILQADQAGSFQETLTLESNDPDRPRLVIPLEALLSGTRPEGNVRPLSGIRELYMLLSGDYELTGIYQPDGGEILSPYPSSVELLD